jgi:peptidoglycan-N-acetylglucosamine deacetylase
LRVAHGPGTGRHSVFSDPTGRRWRRARRLALVAGVGTTILAAVVVVAVLSPPPLPVLAPGAAGASALSRAPTLATSRVMRARLAARRRLYAALHRHRPAPALRPSALPLPRRGMTAAPGTSPINAGFYVDWDDNSFASFKAHIADLDWVICEWAFLADGDSLRVRVDPRVPYLAARQPAGDRPAVILMVTNYDSATQSFDVGRARALLADSTSRARTARQLAGLVRQYGLQGVAIDLEELGPDQNDALVDFTARLHALLAPAGALTTEAVPYDGGALLLRRLAAAADYLLVMLYDEHYGRGDAGPVASQAWYAAHARRVLSIVPPAKSILAIGAYGYDWNDAGPGASGSEMTFEDAMAAARDNHVEPGFDPVSLNPYVTWTDPDSTDHVVWYLDAVTAYDQVRVARTLGAAGRIIWRLGAEDPSLWSVLSLMDAPGDTADGAHRAVAAAATIPAGYNVEFHGTGELLDLVARPAPGHRDLTVDPASGLVVGEHYTRLPSSYVVRRFGAARHEVALTFDDGPDPTFTPEILDTLRSRGAPATFFVIGVNVESQIPLLRRMLADGDEIGNHTFTHPNLALTSSRVTRLELTAMERLLEAVLDRRTAFFRPPYFGDAEPTTADELVPIGIATDLGYTTVGVHIDSEDWRRPGVQQIVQNVLGQLARGNVILLHDGGGDRTQTVAALGPLIDSLRVRGDTLVPLSKLAGLSRAQAMPTLTRGSVWVRAAELASFGLVGVAEWGLHWVFLLAVIIGLGRLLYVLSLAALQRRRAHRRHTAGSTFAPRVTIVVPAYNEAKVIVRTVSSLLAQQYAGPLDVIIVDDGSPDDTAAVARAEFAADPRVSVYRKANGGKASALNYGIARARGEVIVGLDADTLFPLGTLRALVAPLEDPEVGAVAGNAKVGNRINLVTRWQALEYVTTQNLDRRAFSLLDCITVVPGAVGAWRRKHILEAGGFSADTLAEDQDLTLAIRRHGHSIAYADDAVAYTEAPDTLGALARQRFRWAFGTLQCAWKHRDALLRPRYGSLGMVGLPNVWIFQLLFTAISPVADLLFLWSLVSVWLDHVQHGATYALTSLEQVLLLYTIFLLVDWLVAVVAFLMEPGEDRRLIWLVFLQRFAYRQLMYFVVLRSFVAAVRGGIVGWGKLERKATVALPVPQP